MSFGPARVSGVSINGLFQPAQVGPLVESLPIALALRFLNPANLLVSAGTYTPANDVKNILVNVPFAQAPNFMLVVCDALTVVTTDSNAASLYFLKNLPVVRSSFLSWQLDPAAYVTTLYLNGQTSALVPMVQGTPVNYTIVTGQADIS